MFKRTSLLITAIAFSALLTLATTSRVLAAGDELTAYDETVICAAIFLVTSSDASASGDQDSAELLLQGSYVLMDHAVAISGKSYDHVSSEIINYSELLTEMLTTDPDGYNSLIESATDTCANLYQKAKK